MDSRLTEKLTLPSLIPSSSYCPSFVRELALSNGHPFMVIQQYLHIRHLFLTRQVIARTERSNTRHGNVTQLPRVVNWQGARGGANRNSKEQVSPRLLTSGRVVRDRRVFGKKLSRFVKHHSERESYVSDVVFLASEPLRIRQQTRA